MKQTISESNWETFRTNKYLDKSIDSMGKVYSFYEEDIKDFIRQEKQKSFEEAVRKMKKTIKDFTPVTVSGISQNVGLQTDILNSYNAYLRQKLQSLLKQQ